MSNPIAGGFDGQVAIITGAGGNIGLGTASRILLEGAKVSLVDMSSAALDKAFSTLTKLDLPAATFVTHIRCIVADVTAADDVRRYVDGTIYEWGGLDTVFLCAGIRITVQVFSTLPMNMQV